MFIIRSTAILFMLLSSLSSFSQWDENIFFENDSTYDKGSIIIKIDNFNHFADLEYYNPMVYSYTLAGYHIKPEIVYCLNDKLSISGGIYLMNLLGRDKPQKINPVYSLNYRPIENLEFIFGNIKGGLEHKLTEQIYSYRQAYEEFNEEGIQARFINKNLFFDVWLDWRFLTIPRDNQPERIFGGYNIDYTFNPEDKDSFSIFTNMLAWHNGGQNLQIERNLRTILNFTGGFSYTHRINLTSKIGSKHYFTHYENVIAQDVVPYNRGFGWTSEIQASFFNYWQTKMGFWYSESFHAPLGNFMYGNISEKYPSYFKDYRHVLYLQSKYERSVNKSVRLGVRVGSYFTPEFNETDFYFSLLMRFNHKFFIKN